MERVDQVRLSSAVGWLELGNTTEALLELDAITAGEQKTVGVLSVRWSILAAKKMWVPALRVAEEIVGIAPEEPLGWLNQSYCLHELQRTADAWNQLLLVIGKFPDISTIPYNLACYACQLGRLEEARKWLKRAIEIGGAQMIKATALEDPDLAPLKSEIREW